MEQKEALFEYTLRRGDNPLILGHRLSEWCGHGPILEEDIAMTNIALDLIGQATNFLKYAGEVEGKGRSEDDLAYHRDVMDFRNFNLVELPNGHFGETMLRQFFYDAYDHAVLKQLQQSKDDSLKGIADKAVKEAKYHLRHSTQWIHRLGEGTEESHDKMQDALERLWMYTGELLHADQVEEELHKEGIGHDPKAVEEEWKETVHPVLEQCSLEIPEDEYMFTGARMGHHTEHLGYVLAEMQYLPRAYPEAEW